VVQKRPVWSRWELLQQSTLPTELSLILRDRYEIDKFFVEIQELTSEMESELAAVDAMLEDEVIYQLVRADLSQRYPKTQQTGRGSTPVEVILRMLLVKHLYNLSYAKMIHWINH